MKIPSAALLVLLVLEVHSFTPSNNNNSNKINSLRQAVETSLLKTIVNPTPTIPTIEDWNILETGEVMGTVVGHSVFDDGTTITTSPILDVDAVLKDVASHHYQKKTKKRGSSDGHVVVTLSGSKYILGAKYEDRSNGKADDDAAAGDDDKRQNGKADDWTYDFFKSLFTPPSQAFSSSSSSEEEEGAAAAVNGKKNGKKNPPPSMISAADSIVFRANGVSAVSVKNGKNNNNKNGKAAAAAALNGTHKKTVVSLFQPKNKKTDNNTKSNHDNEKHNKTYDAATLQQKVKEAKVKYNLTGQTIANGKYLLSGKAQDSTSGKSQIWTAYLADPNNIGLPKMSSSKSDGTTTEAVTVPVTIKLTDNSAAIRRESRNYKRVASGLFQGEFVDKIEFLSEIEVLGQLEEKNEEKKEGSSSARRSSSSSSSSRLLNGKSALVLEKGKMDLQEYMTTRDRAGLSGRAMRDAAHSAGKCIQAIHSSNMVWTDLKTDNFVVMDEGVESSGNNKEPFIIKGIDLESAMPLKSNPVDYSPQACPPEFADAYVSGRGHDFILDTSYDMWSLGMMLYELSTGFHYFAGETPLRITKALKNNFQADVSAVKDDKLRDLIEQCLRDDPKKRPTITQFLFHPYFLTSGIGAHSF